MNRFDTNVLLSDTHVFPRLPSVCTSCFILSSVYSLRKLLIERKIEKESAESVACVHLVV